MEQTSAQDANIRQILQDVTRIALVGYSAKPERASYKVARFLAEMGYELALINPALAEAGREAVSDFGAPIYASLGDVPSPETVDMIDVFRRSEAAEALICTLLEAKPQAFTGLKAIWLQLGVTSARAAEAAQGRGVAFVQDRCPKIEYARLM